jgi:D-beta-D-heptose 7-phosphate kinase/D-beta-D-heptose 1-phosphate adenosyltransferase|tara:strand:- start:2496 stop:2960 length:465 start_codon:yes stop_codon:yes gene_type:complete
MINKKIMISGGFDPIHIGHIKMIKAASRWGMVTVVINSDAWLKRKKGYVFMPYDERAAIVSNIIGVTMVSSVDDRDGTVCEAIRRLKPDAFANGGDRKENNTPEVELCEFLDIQLLWGVGGKDKPQSSSWLISEAMKQITGEKNQENLELVDKG